MKLFKSIVDKSSLAIMVTDYSGTVTYANKSAAGLFGCHSVEDLVGHKHSDLDTAISGAAGLINHALIENGYLNRYETRLVNGNGELRDIEVDISRDDETLIFYMRDISIRKEALEKTDQVRRTQETILESIPDPIYLMDGDNRWIYANQATRDLMNINDSIYQHKTHDDILKDAPWLSDEFRQSEELIERAWVQKCPSLQAFRKNWSHGAAKRIYQILRVPHFRQDGSRSLMVTFARDITQIAEAQMHADEHMAMLSSILNNNSIGIAMIENGQIRYSNQVFKSIDPSTPSGVSELQCRTNMTFGVALNEYCDSLPFRTAQRKEFILIDEGKDVRYFEIEGFKSLKPDDTISISLLVHDVTESVIAGRREAELNIRLNYLAEQMENIQQKERASLAREFHDLVGGNISAISIRLGTLKSKISDPPKIADLELCEDMCLQVADTVRKIVRGLQDVWPTEAQAREILMVYSGRYCGMFGLDWELDCDETVESIGRPQLIELIKVMREAINNAAKYSNGTKLKITAGVSDSSCYLAVSDNGIGFVESKINKNGTGIRRIKESIESNGGVFSVEHTHPGVLVKATLPR